LHIPKWLTRSVSEHLPHVAAATDGLVLGNTQE